jgi:hypothetical protein
LRWQSWGCKAVRVFPCLQGIRREFLSESAVRRAGIQAKNVPIQALAATADLTRAGIFDLHISDFMVVDQGFPARSIGARILVEVPRRERAMA